MQADLGSGTNDSGLSKKGWIQDNRSKENCYRYVQSRSGLFNNKALNKEKMKAERDLKGFFCSIISIQREKTVPVQ
jgi:sugar-specific transcriptional regulator TrmB